MQYIYIYIYMQYIQMVKAGKWCIIPDLTSHFNK